MEAKVVLGPVLALVLLTFLSWLYMYFQRGRIAARQKIRINDFGPQNPNLPQGALATGNNLTNLFELPVLFYTLMLLLLVLQQVDTLYLNAAWLFVATRYVHSFIHSTYNRILHRFVVYQLGSFVLWAMWARFGWWYLN